MAAKHLKLTSTSADAAAIQAAADAVNSGEISIVPLETVYAAFARTNHAQAVTKLRRIRQGTVGAMTLHVAGMERALPYIDPPDAFASRLMQKLWPGPIAMVFSVSAARQAEVATRDGLTASDLYHQNLITIRCPAHAVARAVLGQCPHPVAGTPAGDDASRVGVLPQATRESVQIILDDGPAAHGKPSTVIRVHDGGFDIVRSGVYDRRIIEKMLQTTILFVCSGNTCRSPMAEAIAKQVLADSLKIPVKDLEKAGYMVLSAGAGAFPGAPASSNAVIAVKELKADLGAHHSRQLSQQIVNQATVIFGMSRSHLAAIRAISPSAAEKATLLDAAGDIEDPVGGDIGLYKRLAAKIKTLIEQRLADGTLLGGERLHK